MSILCKRHVFDSENECIFCGEPKGEPKPVLPVSPAMTPPTEQARAEALHRALHQPGFNPSKYGDWPTHEEIQRGLIAADPLTAAHEALVAENERLRQRVTELEGALRKRNTHECYCTAITPPTYGLCDCGLLETLTVLADCKALTPNAEGAK